jgi:hypothetical protein
VFVRWETNAAGFILEACPAVTGTTWTDWMRSGAWTPVGPPTFSIADHFYFRESPTNGARFYRLRLSGPRGWRG